MVEHKTDGNEHIRVWGKPTAICVDVMQADGKHACTVLTSKQAIEVGSDLIEHAAPGSFIEVSEQTK